MEILLDGVKYYKVNSLSIGKYEYVILFKDKKIYYVIDTDGSYRFPNPDISLKGNANISLANLNSRIIIDHIKNALDKEIENGMISNVELLNMRLIQIQRILNNPDFFELAKGNINELYHYDDEVNKFKEKFDELYLSLSGLVPHIEYVKPKEKKKIIKEDANIDTIMLVMLANIGVLMFIMFILNIIK